MKIPTVTAALFDFDGVVMDTESQYTVFWDEIGREYLPQYEGFGRIIKGQTLGNIYRQYFQGVEAEQPLITERLNRFERTMTFEYIPGVERFMESLRANGVRMAIVTSSNEEKMANVYAAHPELKQRVDRILTAELFTRSKPAPDCFLLGAEVLGATPDRCVVFEDSFHGIEAGNAAGMAVVGLSTTNSAASIAGRCSTVIPDFQAFTYEKMRALLA